MKKYNKYSMQFMEENDGGGNGEGGSGSGGQTEVNQQQASPSLDPKAFAEQFGEVIAKQFKQRDESQQQNQPRHQPTPEERAAARKQFNMVDIDDDTLTKLDNLETRKATWQGLVDRIYESQGNITAAQLAQINKSWEERFQPITQMLTQREESERVSRFHTKYPQLASEEMAPVIAGIGQKLAEQNAFKGLSESQAFDKLAQGVESVIKHHNPSFSLTKTNQNARSSNEIPTEGSGSRGGGGNSGSGRQAPSQAAAILGMIPSRK